MRLDSASPKHRANWEYKIDYSLVIFRQNYMGIHRSYCTRISTLDCPTSIPSSLERLFHCEQKHWRGWERYTAEKKRFMPSWEVLQSRRLIQITLLSKWAYCWRKVRWRKFANTQQPKSTTRAKQITSQGVSMYSSWLDSPLVLRSKDTEFACHTFGTPYSGSHIECDHM